MLQRSSEILRDLAAQVLLLDGANPVFATRRRLEGARGARQGAVHRQLRQLPRRDERARGSHSARPFVSGVVGRQRAGVGSARCRCRRSRRPGDEAAAPDARDAGRAARGGRQAARRRSRCRGRPSRRASRKSVGRRRLEPPAAGRLVGRRRQPGRQQIAQAGQSASVHGGRRAASSTATRRPVSIPLPPYASQAFLDGSLAHLPWLQELPDPLTSAMWSSWVEINPQTAERLRHRAGRPGRDRVDAGHRCARRRWSLRESRPT